ncbi:MAG: hypothetical protein NC349_01775 [Paenibacillus sp.]|nr:hypothetical protein [Paenibacillus sp.]
MNKYVLFPCLIAFAIYVSSCSGEKNNTPEFTPEEMAKIEKVKQLAKKYGWSEDTTLTETERYREMLKWDLDTLKCFMQLFSEESDSLNNDATV